MASATKSKTTYQRSLGSELLERWRGKLTKRDLVAILDIDQSALAAYETGYRQPGKKRAKKIADRTHGAVPVESWSTAPLQKKRAA